jgi:hypothetical protein
MKFLVETVHGSAVGLLVSGVQIRALRHKEISLLCSGVWKGVGV